MDIRYANHPSQVPGLDSEGLRAQFLVPDLFVPGELRATYSLNDRVIMMGISPDDTPLKLGTFPELRVDNFFERREAGVVNIGEPGVVTVDNDEYRMEKGACLYIGRGAHQVSFSSVGGQAKFYLFSAPAHTEYPIVLVQPGDGNALELGEQKTSNRRTLNQYIYDGGVQSCQVVMGVTTLHEGSMWNTMPAHTHDRRMESYLYFDVPQDARVVHLMGEPSETRHLIVANEQGVISPSWSIHSGVGTSSYSFVWAMAGENQAFDDMDPVDITEMR
ncbi:5-dehydro-4-deoxy-D-glucuronate isomerase [Actinomyces sp. F1_1611]